MIRAYHRARGDLARTEIIVPDAAHGTNPATATMCGCTVREIPSLANGDIDLDALRQAVGPQTAGIMLTNPSTLGVFERRIVEVAAIVHEAGGTALLRRREPERDPRQGAPRRHGVRRHPHEPAQDLLDAARRRRAGLGCGRRQRAAAAVHAGAGRRARRRSLSLARRDRPAADDRTALGVHGQYRRAAARVHLHAHARTRRHAPRVGVRCAQLRTTSWPGSRSRFRACLPRPARRATSSS